MLILGKEFNIYWVPPVCQPLCEMLMCIISLKTHVLMRLMYYFCERTELLRKYLPEPMSVHYTAQPVSPSPQHQRSSQTLRHFFITSCELGGVCPPTDLPKCSTTGMHLIPPGRGAVIRSPVLRAGSHAFHRPMKDLSPALEELEHWRATLEGPGHTCDISQSRDMGALPRRGLEEAAISFLLMRVGAGLAGPGSIQEKRRVGQTGSRSRG